MSSLDELLSTIPTSFASCSIGKTDDKLEDKLDAISGAGFKGIELSWPDLVEYAQRTSGRTVKEDDYDSLVQAASRVGELVKERGLVVMMLQPFSNFEGWPRGSKERRDAFERAKGWIKVMRAVETDLLQVGSTDSEGITSKVEDVVNDLRELAGMLNEHGFRLAYENWAWSTHAPKWRDVWDIVRAVDRPNVGLCLDTFQTAASEFADPTTESGLIDHPQGKKGIWKDFLASLDELTQGVPRDKIYVLQISDAYKLDRPLSDEKDETGLRPRGQWSHDYRPMPFDGGYLPVVDVAVAVLLTGFRGWFSTEIFDSGRDGTGKSYNLGAFAKRAQEAHRKLIQECSRAIG